MKQIKVKIVISAYGHLTADEDNSKKVRLCDIVKDYETLDIEDDLYDSLMEFAAKVPTYQDIYLECLSYSFVKMAQDLLAPRFDDIRRRMLDEGISETEVDEKMSYLDGSVCLLHDDIVRYADTVDMFVKDGLLSRTMTDGALSIVRCVDLNKTQVCSDAAYVEKGAFKNCRHLEVVKLPMVKDIAPEAFSGCTRLATVELSDNVNFINDETFAHCYMLRSFRLPKSLTFIEDSAFYNCCNLETLIYEEDGELHRTTERPKQLDCVRSNAFAFTPLDSLSHNEVYEALLEDDKLMSADTALVEERKVEMAKAVFDKIFNPEELPFFSPFKFTRS